MRPAMRKQILFASLLTSLLLPAGAAFAAPTGQTDPVALIPGVWDWANRPGSCQDNPQTLTLSPDRLRLTLEFKKPVLPKPGAKPQKSEVYKILDARARLLHTVVEGEPRKDPKGQPLTYDFVFASEDSFCWHRSDWPKGQCTKMMVRCSKAAH